MDELPIEVHKAKEGLDLLYLCQIHGNMVLQDDQSKVLNLLLLELTFLWLNLLVFGEGAGVDEDVIHVAYYLAIVDELIEYVIHHCLECCRGVAQSKEHDSWFKQASVSLECSLPLITLLNPHIVEPPVEVEYCEELSVMEVGQDIRDKRG